MAKREFTKEQMAAINTRDKTLLVSAAAGSGKTATLTERIIRSLTDEKNPQDISEMLIVTFTNAAVNELRERISAALKESLSLNRENERLLRQLNLLPLARICTIDSFCEEIVRTNAEHLGITPSYRIADTAEAKLLTKELLSSLIEGIYQSSFPDVASPEEFEILCDSLTGVKTDATLEEIFALLYENTKSLEEGVKIWYKFAKEYDTGHTFEDNRYVKYVMDRAKSTASHYKLLFEKQLENLPCNINPTAITCAISFVQHIESSKTYEELSCALTEKLAAMPKGSSGVPELAMHILAREEMKAELKKCSEKFFSFTKDEWLTHLSQLACRVNTLARFLEKFDSLYLHEKYQRGILEYSDVERLAYECLYKDGEPTDLAFSMKERFCAVYIDEYQDVNSLQNKIFEALSRPDNRFMVGDIKQSIYGFRNAKPEIFAGLKESYPSLSNAKGSSAASIFMSKNFRCDRGIIDFTNEIFDKMFTLTSSSIGYVQEDRLTFAKLYEFQEPQYRTPEVRLFEKSDYNKQRFSSEDHNLFCPKWTAKKIKELLSGEEKLNDGSPITPKDIAIILRKGAGRARLYAKELEQLGIKAALPEDRDFFLNSEVLLVISVLNSIDNPRKDIYLSAIMLSPIFDFTPDELVLMRHKQKNLSLWESLNLYTEQTLSFQKGKNFISFINRMRQISEGINVAELLLRIYNETDMLSLAKTADERENLLLLFDYARKFEAASYEGLYNFINYINSVIDTNAKFSKTDTGKEEDAVTVMTVHKSKGLEFPVVFVCDASAPLISEIDRRAKVAYSEEFGIGMKLRIKDKLALVESPVHAAIIDYNSKKIVEEELRIYYVALTRARERLFVTGLIPTINSEEFLTLSKVHRTVISPHTLRQMRTFVDILSLCLPNYNFFEELDLLENEKEFAMPKQEIRQDLHAPSYDGFADELLERFNYKYAEEELTRLPQKLSISTLYPKILDEDSEEQRLTIDDTAILPNDLLQEEKIVPLPEFISPTKPDLSRKMGIATHNFLQFFDMDNLLTQGVEQELRRLTEKEFISKENASIVRLDEIEKFKLSRLFQEMKEAESIFREFRFNIPLDASSFTNIPEKKKALAGKKILVQGVIDCLYLDKCGNLHLVDYKTDRLSKKELSDKNLARKKLSEKHSLQLSYYKEAVTKIFGKAPTSVKVYSLHLGDTVDI